MIKAKAKKEKKRIWPLLLILLLGLLGTTIFQQIQIQKIQEVQKLSPAFPIEELEKVKESVVILKFRLKLVTKEGEIIKEKKGIGVVVEEGNQKYIISLCHLLTENGKYDLDFVKKNREIYLDSGKGKGRRLEWRADPQVDLVVFKLAKDLNYPPLPMGDSQYCQLGQPVLFLGFPYGEDFMVREGIIGALRAPAGIMSFLHSEGIILGEEDIFLFSYIPIKGDSGGPILALQKGEFRVIGFQKGGRGVRIGEEVVPSLSFGIKIGAIKPQFQELIKKF